MPPVPMFPCPGQRLKRLQRAWRFHKLCVNSGFKLCIRRHLKAAAASRGYRSSSLRFFYTTCRALLALTVLLPASSLSSSAGLGRDLYAMVLCAANGHLLDPRQIAGDSSRAIFFFLRFSGILSYICWACFHQGRFCDCLLIVK